MGSVYEEITRLETAKADIETAIEGCGVNVPDTDLISTYALYIRQIPSAVFSELNVDPVGGEDMYIKSIELKDGLITAATGGLVSSTSSGIVPKIVVSSTAINNQANDWILTSTSGNTPAWKKLPTSAFYTYVGTTELQATPKAQELTGIKNIIGENSKEIIHATDGYLEFGKGFSDVITWFNASLYKFKLGNTQAFIITTDGKVGIGDVGGAPKAKLHVAGGSVLADSYHAWSGGFSKEGCSDAHILLAGGGHKAVSDFASASGVVTALSTSGNLITWTKNGIVNTLTVPYATIAGSANYINYTTRADKGNATAQFCQYSGETNNPTNDWYSHIIMNHNNSAGYYTEIATCFHSDSVYFRRQSNGTTYAWKTFAWTSDIPTKTSQLTNDSGYLTSLPSHDHSYLPLSGGTMTSTANISWTDRGTWGNASATYPYSYGGLSWSGTSDWIKIYAKEAGSDALNLVFDFGDDSGHYITFRDNGTEYTMLHSGNIGSQSVNYANSAGSANSVAWTNVSGKPTLFTANGSTGKVDLNTIKTNGSYYIAPDATNNPGSYGELLCISNVDTHGQIYIPYSADAMKFRGANDANGYYDWRTILDSSNYTNYTVKKDGTGATGTWGINITGNAGSSTVTLRFKLLLTGSATTSKDLNTALSGGGIAANYSYPISNASGFANAPSGSLYGCVIQFSQVSDDLNGLLAWDVNHRGTDSTRCLWWRANDDTGFANAKWHQIAFTDTKVLNASNADTLDGFHAEDLYGYVSPSDLNNVIRSEGIAWTNYDYATSTSVINLPTGNNAYDARGVITFWTEYPLLLSWRYNNAGSLYARTRYSGTWNAWNRIAMASDIPTVSNSNGYVPRFVSFPAYSDFGSSTDTYDYLQNIVKWIYDNANYGEKTYLMGVGNPNSLGMMNIQLYGTSGKNGEGYPRYCSGTFLNLGDSAFEIFGTNNYNYYRYRLSVDGHSHRITKLHRRDAGDDYSLQHHWTGSYWYLRGYLGDSYHAGVQVEYANNAGSATKDSAGNTISSYYLPLSGGTMTGTIITPGNDTVVIKPKYNNYDQIGGEGQAFWKIWATNFYGTLNGSADQVDGYHISVVTSLPSTKVNNTIYILV